MMVPHAANWDINEPIGTSLKSPPTDFTKLARIIHDSGYRGFPPLAPQALGRKGYKPASEVTKAQRAMRREIAELN